MRTAPIIFFLLLFLAIDSNAQKEPSVDGLKSTLKSIKKSLGVNSLEYIDKLTELAILCNHLADYKSALKHIEKANNLVEKKLAELQLVNNNVNFKPEITYPLSIKILATRCQIYSANKQPYLKKAALSATPSIDFGLQSKNRQLVEMILGTLYFYFDFNTSFFQAKWAIAAAPEIGVPKELRLLQCLEKYSKLNSGEFSKKHTSAIIRLAIFYKQNRLKADYDRIKLILDQIAPDTLSKMDINLEQLARFPGCEIEGMSIKERKYCSDQKLLDFIYSNIEYPQEAIDKNIKGTVVIKFIVNEKGKITDTAIVRDIGEGCGAEALRIINLMNSLPSPWIPGMKENQLAQVEYNLPIKFSFTWVRW